MVFYFFWPHQTSSVWSSADVVLDWLRVSPQRLPRKFIQRLALPMMRLVSAPSANSV